MQVLYFSTQHVVLIPTKFFKRVKIDIELRNKSYMFLFSFVLLAQEAFLSVVKTDCKLAKLAQRTNPGKNKPKLLLTKLLLLNFPNLIFAFRYLNDSQLQPKPTYWNLITSKQNRQNSVVSN